MNPADPHLAKTRLLDFDATSIAKLIEERGWADLPSDDRIGAIYDFVRNEITFGYNRADDIPASEVLADGHGQCNTKGTLLMALLRGVGVRCRLHGFTIHKALQRRRSGTRLSPRAVRNPPLLGRGGLGRRMGQSPPELRICARLALSPRHPSLDECQGSPHPPRNLAAGPRIRSAEPPP